MRLGDIKNVTCKVIYRLHKVNVTVIMNSPQLVKLYFYYHTIADAGRRVHIHRLLPLHGTSDGHGSNRRPAGEPLSTKRYLS